MASDAEADPWASSTPPAGSSPEPQQSDAASEASEYFEDAEQPPPKGTSHEASPALPKPGPSSSRRSSAASPTTPTAPPEDYEKADAPDEADASGSAGARTARSSLATTLWRASLQEAGGPEGDAANIVLDAPVGLAAFEANGASDGESSLSSPANRSDAVEGGGHGHGNGTEVDASAVQNKRQQRWRKSIQELRDAQEEGGEATSVDWDFWGAVMNDYEQVARTQPRELSRAIQAGIPSALRGMMWQLMSSSKDTDLESIYSHLLGQSSAHEKAISRDLGRTFPQHEYFQNGGGVGQDSLMAVCKAYSLYDEEVGYTQGLQFIVGPLLLNMPDEEAFCVLVRLMKSYDLRSHFTPNMPGLQLRLFQFDRLLEELLPHVFMHLLRQGIKSSMYASQWFLTLFGYRFPLDLVSVVMDLVFAEGVEAVFRFSLALMKKNEEKICSLDFDALLDFLKLDLFEPYREPEEASADESAKAPNPRYRPAEFVREALQVKITPVMLDQYAAEWDAMCRQQNAHTLELEALRQANSKLSAQVRRLEASLAQINEEHCDLVKQVVMAKLEREELEEELVKFKLAFAEMSHRHASSEATRNRASFAANTGQ